MEEVNNFKGEDISNKPIIDITSVHVNTEVEGRRKVEADSHGVVDASRINVGNWAIGPYRRKATDNRSVDDVTVNKTEVGK